MCRSTDFALTEIKEVVVAICFHATSAALLSNYLIVAGSNGYMFIRIVQYIINACIFREIFWIFSPNLGIILSSPVDDGNRIIGECKHCCWTSIWPIDQCMKSLIYYWRTFMRLLRAPKYIQYSKRFPKIVEFLFVRSDHEQHTQNRINYYRCDGFDFKARNGATFLFVCSFCSLLYNSGISFHVGIPPVRLWIRNCLYSLIFAYVVNVYFSSNLSAILSCSDRCFRMMLLILTFPAIVRVLFTGQESIFIWIFAFNCHIRLTSIRCHFDATLINAKSQHYRAINRFLKRDSLFLRNGISFNQLRWRISGKRWLQFEWISTLNSVTFSVSIASDIHRDKLWKKSRWKMHDSKKECAYLPKESII